MPTKKKTKKKSAARISAAVKKKAAAPKKQGAARKRGASTGKHSTTKENRNESLKKELYVYRKKILQEAKEEIGKLITGEKRQLVDTSLDDADLSVIDLSEDVELRKLSAHKETLNKIDESLRKIDDGTYGLCEDCESDIGEARLKVMPYAIHCVTCKEQKEKLEEVQKPGEH